jgi:hypothetical protein
MMILTTGLTHFGPSTATKAMINFSNSFGSKAGKDTLVDEVSILRQLQSGLNNLSFPS